VSELAPPFAILAELTHRCPLHCPYCSNPLALTPTENELDARTWRDVLAQAADLGALQVHISGGEPLARSDLDEICAGARDAGLYANLITSGIGLDERRCERLVAAGVDHVQLSLQGSSATADALSGLDRAHEKKLAAARVVVAAGLPLTLNWVAHRQSAHDARAVIELAVELGAERLEIAHVQLYGWGLHNRAALLPTREQVDEVFAVVEAARVELRGVLRIDAVVPDYYARRPKPCMNGWGRQFLAITPAGRALPCHAAESIPGLAFDSVRERSLAWIWRHSQAFQRYRGVGALPAQCQTCEHQERDWGGCRCQTLALTGDADAVDPSCIDSPHHQAMRTLAARLSNEVAPTHEFRGAAKRSLTVLQGGS
jgi:PqqA peptide cyclase